MGATRTAGVLLMAACAAGCSGRSTLTVENLTPHSVRLGGYQLQRRWHVPAMSAYSGPIHIRPPKIGIPALQPAVFSATPIIPDRPDIRSWDIELTRPGPYVLRVIMEEGDPVFERVEVDRTLRHGSSRIRVKRGPMKLVGPAPGPDAPP